MIKWCTIFLLVVCSWVGADPAVLTFLTFNDVYKISPVEGWGGFAEMQRLLEQERADAEHVIVTINGDFLAPSLLSTQTQGAHMVDFFNRMGVDLVVPGNHEFDYGAAHVSEMIDQSDFVWLATNVRVGGEPLRGSYDTWIVEKGGLRVGFFGICTPDTLRISNPGPGVTFGDYVECARQSVELLKEQGAEFIVALTHLRVMEDIELVEKVEGLDLILGGHEHRPVTYMHNGTLLHKSGYDAHFLGRLDIEVTEEGWVPRWQMIPNYKTAPDPALLDVVREYESDLDSFLDEVMGVAEIDLDARWRPVRTSQTTFGRLVTEAMRQEMGADVAIINGGFFSGDTLIAQGEELTRRNLLPILAYPNRVVVVEATGAQIERMCEGCRVVQLGGINPNYPQVSGPELQPETVYRLAVTDFMLSSIDGLSDLPLVVPPSSDNRVAEVVFRYLN